MSDDITLVAMRLKDMRLVHPRQDNSRACSRCGETVGVYPVGQKALAQRPEMKILCHVCVELDPGGENEPAGSIDEIVQEVRDSRPARTN